MQYTNRRMGWAFVITIILVAGLCQSCFAVNLIPNNPGFDTLLTTLNKSSGTWLNGGWNFEIYGGPTGSTTTYFMSESKGGAPKYTYIGDALRIAQRPLPSGVGNYAWCKAYQDIEVMPGANYTASVYVRTDNRFGLNPTYPDFAGLWIQEMKDDGTVVVDHPAVGVTASTAAYVQQQLAFTTDAQTTKVRFICYTHVQFTYVDGSGGIKFDAAVLDGPPITRAVTGRVTSGGVGVDDATISCPGAVDATTAGGGYYTIDAPVSATLSALRASKDGYFAQKKWRAVPKSPAVTVDYDLVPVGTNLVANAGFDDCSVLTPYTTVPDGWSLQRAGTFQKESYWTSVSLPAYYKSGEEAAYLYTTGSPGETSLFQVIPALPNSSYTAKVWAFAQANVGSYWYSGSDQKAALVIQEIDRTGTVVQEHKEYLTDFADWQQLSYTLITGPSCRMIRLACWANMVDDYNFTLSNVIFDDAELSGAAGPAMPPLYGAVKDRSTGAGISGAYVELTGAGYNTTTASDGYWEFSPPPANYTIKAGAGDAYYVQRIARTSPSGPNVLSLEPVGDNLLGDAGFDDYRVGTWAMHWSRIWPSSEAFRTVMTRVRTETLSGGSPKYFDVGEESIALYPYKSSNMDGWIYQKMAVLPSTQYTAKARFHAAWTPGQTSSWGTNPSQTASLYVKEYDSSGTLLFTTTVPATFANTAEWETLTATFTTDSQTDYVEVGGYTFIVDDTNANYVRAVFDSMELNGPTAPYSLGGNVTNGGSPVSGATVVVTDLNSVPTIVHTTSTNGSGVYTVPGAKRGHEYNIRVSGIGFYAMQKGTVVNGVVALDFAVQPLNMLFNAGFDDGVRVGWQVDISASSLLRVGSEMLTARFNIPGFVDFGEDSLAIWVANNTAGFAGKFFQDIPVQSGQAYTASCKFHASWLATAATAWGTNPSQLAKLTILEYDAAGAPIGTEQSAQATLVDPANWETLTLSFTTSANTASVRVGGYAYIVDGYNLNLGHAVFDTFSLTGPAAVGKTLATLKGQADGSSVTALGKVVSASYDGFFYIEEPDRTSGIRVDGYAPVGTVVDVTGTLLTLDGERRISYGLITLRSQGTTPDPLGLNNRASGVGLSPVGLYVTMWGKVDSVDAGTGSFTMTDGSGTSLKVYGAATLDDSVSVKGALGAELSGATVVPVLRAVEVDKKN